MEAAKQFSGITLNVVWEDGLQLEDPSKFSGPMFEELTGIKINPIGKPFPELFPSQVAEHIGETGAYDVLSFPPSWTADFVSQGMVEPLDPFIDQYGNPEDLNDYHPLYRGLMNYNDQIYGLFDDGDTIILYYRTDLFADQANMDEFMAAIRLRACPAGDVGAIRRDPGILHREGWRESWGGASQRAAGQVYGWFGRSSATAAADSSIRKRWTPRSTVKQA